jgi:addiction module RelE/StbE family toxin
MSGYALLITPRALKDLEQIHAYISIDSPQNASGMIERLLDSLEPRKRFPHRSIAPHQSSRIRNPVRSLSVQNYTIFYRVLEKEKVVRILTIRHAARRRPTRFD